LRTRSESNECANECAAEAAGNPPELCDEICATCPWGREFEHPLLMAKLVHFAALLDSGCPVERNELIDEEWHWLGVLRTQRANTKSTPSKKWDALDGNRRP